METDQARHALADIIDPDLDLIEDRAAVEAVLRAIVDDVGLGPAHDPVTHKFEPQGLTSFIVFTQSHLSIHTYPEYHLAKVDAFTYSSVDPARLIELLAARLGGRVQALTLVDRGKIGSDD